MRQSVLAMLGLCFLFAFHTPVVIAQDDALTADEKTWLEGILRAGWSGSSGTKEVSVSARSAPMMDDHLVSVLGKADELSIKQREALLEGIRIEVKAAGWLKSIPVEPGTYSVGFRQGPHNLQTVLRDPKGAVLNIGGMTLSEGTPQKPVTSCYHKHGCAQLEAKWGDVSFSWFYVSAKAHSDAIGAVTERKAGRVSVFSDLPDEARIQEIADLSSKAVAANETLMGAELPKDFRYRIYLLGTLDAYKDIDDLLTGGAFSRNGAFTAQLTGLSYLWYYTHSGEDYALPSSLLEVVIHEFHHQYIYRALPSLAYSPTWFQEACAEVAAQKGLELADTTAAENYRARRMNELVFCNRAGQLPNSADIQEDMSIDSITAAYTAFWVIGDALAATGKDLHEIAAAMSEHQLSWKLEETLCREFDARYPTVTEILSKKLDQARKGPPGWIKNNCCVDEREGVLELNSEIGSGGFALLNQPVKGDSFKLSGEFHWDDVAGPQVDFYFTYSEGAKAQRFMKLALLPAKVVLFENDNGDWTTLSVLNYDTNLDIVDDKGAPVWHGFTFTFDAKQQVARLDLSGGRYAKFTLADYYSVRDTYTGVGVFNGVIWFRNVKLE